MAAALSGGASWGMDDGPEDFDPNDVDSIDWKVCAWVERPGGHSYRQSRTCGVQERASHSAVITVLTGRPEALASSRGTKVQSKGLTSDKETNQSVPRCSRPTS